MYKRWLIFILIIMLFSACYGQHRSDQTRINTAANSSVIQKPTWMLEIPEKYIDLEFYTDSLFIDGDRLYLTSQSNRELNATTILYSIDRKTGTQLWRKQIDLKTESYMLYTYLIIKDGHIYYQSNNEKTICLNGLTGDQEWEYSSTYSLLAVGNNRLHIKNMYMEYIILDSATGELKLNNHAIDKSAKLFLDKDYSFLINDQSLIVKDIDTDKELWSTNSILYPKYVTTYEDVLLVTTYNSFFAFDLKTGNKLWEKDGSFVNHVINNGNLYLESTREENTQLNEIQQRDIRSGQIINRIPLTSYQPGILMDRGRNISLFWKGHYDRFAMPSLFYGITDGFDKLNTTDFALNIVDKDQNKLLWTTDLIWGNSISKPVIADGQIYFSVSNVEMRGKARIYSFALN